MLSGLCIPSLSSHTRRAFLSEYKSKAIVDVKLHLYIEISQDMNSQADQC